MRITIESTSTITEIGGVPVRTWDGVTERGTKCFVFARLLAVKEGEPAEQFEQDLIELSSNFKPLKDVLI